MSRINDKIEYKLCKEAPCEKILQWHECEYAYAYILVYRVNILLAIGSNGFDRTFYLLIGELHVFIWGQRREVMLLSLSIRVYIYIYI